VVNANGDQINITDGTLSGDGQNLFHSFRAFGLSEGQIANFLANPDLSNILSRVTGGELSQIDGLIQVTGGSANLFLMNPAGIVFGPHAQLNLSGSFTATTATAIEFDNGWFNAYGPNDYFNLFNQPTGFEFNTDNPSAVVNAGDLAVAPAQNLTLLGGNVVNTGSVTAPGGQITLTSVPGTSRVQLGQAGSLLKLEFDLPQDDHGQPIPFTPMDLHQLLTTGQLAHTGVTETAGGEVALADSGTVIPTDLGTTIVSGVLDAANGALGALGGQVDVLGNMVGLIGATVDASGDAGGGSVRIGGDFQGQGTVPNAELTVVDGDSSILADALSQGNGGEVIVWADGTTRFGGELSAQGGTLGGDGGFAEVSGKQSLQFNGQVDLSATQGQAGTLLLDPLNIQIVDAGADTDLVGSTGDDGDSNTYGFGEDTGTSAGLDADVITAILDGGTTVTLQADNDITVDEAIDASGATTAGGGLTLQAGNDIAINFNILTNNGAVSLTANDPGGTATGTGAITMAGGTTINAGTQSITLNAAGNIAVSSLTTTGNVMATSTAGAITDVGAGVSADVLTANAATGITLDTTVNSINASTSGTGAINIIETDAITLTDVDTNDGSITVQAGGAITATDVASLTDSDANDISLTTTSGDIDVALVNAGALGDATLNANAAGAITDGGAGVTADVLTADAATGITLDTTVNSLNASTSGAGAINITEADAITLTDVDTNDGSITVQAGGIITATDVASLTDSSANDINLTTTSGNIDVALVNAGALGDVTLNAAGAITESGADAGADITASSVRLDSATGIGSAGNPLETAVTTLAAQASTSGDVVIANNGALTVGTVNGLTGVTATGGAIDLSASSPLTVNSDVISSTNLTLTAADSAATGDDLTITNNSTVQSTTGNVVLNAGDDFSLTSGSTVDSTTGTVTINLDPSGTDADGGTGGTLTIVGAVTSGGGTTLQGGNDADTFNIQSSLTANALGGAGDDNFAFTNAGSLGTGTIDGEGGTGDTLTGDDDGNSFAITGANSGTLTGKTSGWSNIENLIGGTGVDSFTLNGGTLSGSVDGQGGTDTLTGDNVANAFTVTGANSGTATGTGGFSNIENLVGNANTDSFTLNGGTLSGSVDGQGGTDTLTGDNVANAFTVTGTNSGTATGTGGFSNIENLVGNANTDSFTLNGGTLSGSVDGQGGTDTLTGDNVANTFTVTGANSGTATGVTGGFTNVESLVGNANTDSFTLSGGGTLSGSVDGQGGTDTLNADNVVNTFMVTGTGSGTATGVSGGFSNIETVVGGTSTDTVGGTTGNDTFDINGGDQVTVSGIAFSNVENLDGKAGDDSFTLNGGTLSGSIEGGGDNDTLTGDNVANAFTVTSANGGAATGVGGGFTNVESLVGNADADSFTLSGGGTLSGSVDGQGGSDTLTGDNVANTFTVTSANGGTATGVAGGFTNVESLVGNADTDSFTLNGGTLDGSIDGGAGIDTLNADNVANTFMVTGTNNGMVTGVAGGFTNIENISGGTNTDTVGGTTGNDSFVIDGVDQVTVAGITFSNIENLDGKAGDDNFSLSGGTLSGSIVGGADNDTLTGDNVTNTFTVTGTNSGTATGVTGGFSTVENLTGNAQADSFTFSDAGSLSGAVDGQGGTDTLTGDSDGNSFTITGTNSGTLTGKTSGWSNVENLVGGNGVDTFTVSGGVVASVDGAGGTSDLLTGDNTVNTWTLTGSDQGNVNNANGTIAFSNLENLTGGNLQDSFLFTNGDSLTGTLSGGDPTTNPGDILSVIGNGTTDTALFTPSTTMGNGVVNFSGSNINFTGLESIDLSSLLTATLSPAGAVDNLTLANSTSFISGGTQAIRVSGSTAGTTIPTVALFDNTTVTIDTTAAAGTDTITITNANNAHNNTNLTINTGTTETGDSISINGDATVTGQASFTTGGTITNGGGTLTANTAKLDSGAGVGTGTTLIATTVNTLAAQATTSGGVFIRNTAALTIDTVDGLSDLTTNAGTIVVKTGSGSITVNDGANGDNVGISAGGTNNVLVQTEGAGSDITLNVGTTSGGGNVSILATNDINLPNAVSDITTSNADIDLQATAGTLTSINGVAITSNGTGDIRQQVAGDLTLAHLTNAGTGNVDLRAGGSILDDTDTNAVDIQGEGLLLSAGTNIGANDNFIETTVNTVSGTAAGADGINLLNSDTITVDTVAVPITQVQMDGGTSTTTNTDSDLTTTANNGEIILQTTNGTITINDGDANNVGVSTNGTGNVLLQAQGTGQDIVLNTAVNSGGGNISVLAADSVTQANATADITTAGAGTIDVEATAGSIAMGTNTTTASTDTGNIRYNAGADVGVGSISTTGDVSIVAGGNILDVSAATNTSNAEDDTATNISANNLRLNAGGNIGDNTEFLETAVTTVSAAAGGTEGINLLDEDTITVDAVGAISVNRVQMDSTTAAETDTASQSDLTTTASGGTIALKTTDGSITINDGTDGDGLGVSATGGGAANILIQAGETTAANTTDVTLAAGVRTTGTGNISIIAADNINRTSADADITTAGGTIDIEATNGTIGTFTGATVESSNGNILFNASGNIDITNSSAGIGDITVISSTSDITGTTSAANQLSLQAPNGSVGESSNALSIAANTVAALARDGIFLLEADDVTVGQVGTTGVERVQMNASTTMTIEESQLSDLSTTSNGAIVLQTTDGSITVDDGTTNNDGLGVNANGSGNVLIEAQGTGQNVTLNAGVTSGTGNISVIAPNAVSQTSDEADITTTGGTIDVEAGGAITMASNALANSNGGDVRYVAGTDVTLGQLNAGTGNIRVEAQNGNIISNTLANFRDFLASGLQLLAGVGVGQTGNEIDTSVTTLAASAGSGGIQVTEVDGITIDTVTTTIQRVQSNGTPVASPQSLSDLTTTNSGTVNLDATNGSIQINDGDGNNQGINATGAVALTTAETGSQITAGSTAAIVTTGDDVALSAPGTIAVADITTTSTTGNGGNVTITPATGSASTGNIDTSSNSGNGGDVAINTQTQTITTGDIDARSTSGGAGGDVVLNTVTDTTMFPALVGVTDTADTDNAGDGGDVTITTLGPVVQTGNINTSSTNGGGDLTTTPGTLTQPLDPNITTNISTGDIITRSETGSGAAGNVTLRNNTLEQDFELGRSGGSDSDTDIQTGAIDARGTGAGGIVTVMTERFFRATNSFFVQELNNFQASIATTGGDNTGTITINHGGNGQTLFSVSSLDTNNGTAGGLISGDGALGRNIDESDPSRNEFLFTTFGPGRDAIGNISLYSVPNPTGQENLEVGLNTGLQPETGDFEPTNLSDVQDALRDIQADTGVVPAIIALNFVPQQIPGEVSSSAASKDSVANKQIGTPGTSESILQLTLITPSSEISSEGVFTYFPKDQMGDPITLTAFLREGGRFVNEVSLANDRSRRVFQRKIQANNSYRPSAETLYDWLIRPMQAQLQQLEQQAIQIAQEFELEDSSINLLFTMPTAPNLPDLSLIPLAAMHDGQQFIIEKNYSIGLAPQLGLLDFTLSPIDPEKSKVLVMGSSDFPEIGERSGERERIRPPSRS
jgi:filamentous hemagglutinin family protein